MTFLVGCGSSNTKQVIRDSIFRDEQNHIVFGEEGKEAYMIRDPIFEDEDN